MPTASTAQILGNYECFEPIMTNMYSRRVLSGDHLVINKYMVKDLQLLGIWSKQLKTKELKPINCMSSNTDDLVSKFANLKIVPSLSESDFISNGKNVKLQHIDDEEIEKIKGYHSNEIQKILGYVSKSEVVHKDDLVPVVCALIKTVGFTKVDKIKNILLEA